MLFRSGKGDIRFNNGAIAGADLTAIARVFQSLLTAPTLGNAVGDNAKTEFGTLGGTFTIQDGVMRTTDVKLEGPTVEMNGQGAVDLGERTMDLRFVPRARAGIPGLKQIDIGIPFYVKGPWLKPDYGPDAGAMAKIVVNTVKDTLQNAVQSPGDVLKNPGDALRSLFGGGR